MMRAYVEPYEDGEAFHSFSGPVVSHNDYLWLKFAKTVNHSGYPTTYDVIWLCLVFFNRSHECVVKILDPQHRASSKQRGDTPKLLSHWKNRESESFSESIWACACSYWLRLFIILNATLAYKDLILCKSWAKLQKTVLEGSFKCITLIKLSELAGEPALCTWNIRSLLVTVWYKI